MSRTDNPMQGWLRAASAGSAIGGFAVVLASCTSVPAPTEQMAVSTSAIANAASAGGAQYAPAELASARQKLDRASLAMEKKDYALARQLAEQAQADARLAEKIAESTKARKAAAVVQEDVRVLHDELNRKSN